MALLKLKENQSTIEMHSLLKPKKSLCINPQDLYGEHAIQDRNRFFDFQDLISLIRQVKIKDGEVKIVRRLSHRDDLYIPVGLE
jgi:hypothetical protein